MTGGHFRNTFELLNLRALKCSPVNKIHIFQCLGKIFCVEFQRYPLKFHTKYLTHTLKDMIFIQHWNYKPKMVWRPVFDFNASPSAPSHYLNQCWVMLNWTLRNKLQWNFNKSFSFTKMHLKISSAKWQPFCPRGDELSYTLSIKLIHVFPDVITTMSLCQSQWGGPPLSCDIQVSRAQLMPVQNCFIIDYTPNRDRNWFL